MPLCGKRQARGFIANFAHQVVASVLVHLQSQFQTDRLSSIHVNELVQGEDGLAEIGDGELLKIGFWFVRAPH